MLASGSQRHRSELLGLLRLLGGGQEPVGGDHEPLNLHVDRLDVALHLLTLSLVVLTHDFSFRMESCHLGVDRVC